MTRYALLLRGINVGGATRVPMAQLRAVLAADGFGDPATYIQSGNIVCGSDAERATVAPRVAELIASHFAVTTTVLLRDRGELDAVIAGNPWAARRLDPAKLTVAFAATPVGKAPTVREGWPEEIFAATDHLYIHYPHGQGRSKLTTGYLEQHTGTSITIRNWRTITKLHSMVEE